MCLCIVWNLHGGGTGEAVASEALVKGVLDAFWLFLRTEKMLLNIKKAAKNVISPLRPRLKPSFFVIGAQKAGTSALFNMLALHPKVIGPIQKEIHFFDRDKNYKLGDKWYFEQFPLKPLRYAGELTFEATPGYLYYDRCASRLKDLVPNAKLIAILRDPVKRAYSAWNMRRQLNGHHLYSSSYEARSFEDCVREEMSSSNNDNPLNELIARGEYATQLTRYFNLFGKENVLVVNYKSFKADPESCLDDICIHVGLSPFEHQGSVKNMQFNKRPYSERLSRNLEDELYEYFAPKLEELNELLGYDVDLIE